MTPSSNKQQGAISLVLIAIILAVSALSVLVLTDDSDTDLPAATVTATETSSLNEHTPIAEPGVTLPEDSASTQSEIVQSEGDDDSQDGLRSEANDQSYDIDTSTPASIPVDTMGVRDTAANDRTESESSTGTVTQNERTDDTDSEYEERNLDAEWNAFWKNVEEKAETASSEDNISSSDSIDSTDTPVITEKQYCGKTEAELYAWFSVDPDNAFQFMWDCEDI